MRAPDVIGVLVDVYSYVIFIVRSASIHCVPVTKVLVVLDLPKWLRWVRLTNRSAQSMALGEEKGPVRWVLGVGGRIEFDRCKRW